MSWIASGVGMPDKLPNYHLLFINVILGYIISFLYHLSLKVEWYSLVIVTIQLFSFSCLQQHIINSKKSKFLKLLLFLLLFAYEVRIFVLLQFTTTAAIAAMAGIVLILSNRRYINIIGVILFMVASLLRFEAAMLVGCVSAPFILFFSKKFRYTFIHYFFLAIVICFSVLLKSFDSYIYQSDPDWKELREYNSVRGKISDNPNFLNFQSKDIDTSISMNDISFFEFLALNSEILSTEVLHEIKASIDANTTFFQKIANVKELINGPIIMFFIFGTLFLFLYLIVYEKISYWKIFALLFYIFLLFVVISFEGRVKMRVFLSMILPVWYFSSKLLSGDFTKRYIKLLLMSVFSYLIFGLFAYSTAGVYQSIKRKSVIETQLSLINRQDPNCSIMPLGASLNVELLPFMEITNSIVPRIAISHCYLPSPISKEVDNHIGFIDSNIYLFANKNVALPRARLFQKEFIEHYSLPTTVCIVDESDDYMIFNFTKKDKK
ncbi:hypothetical protein N9251_02765 [Gammaproteobacteria bacterium]|nr:hypothetical protein [Gammaproteobacteria bacterium]